MDFSVKSNVEKNSKRNVAAGTLIGLGMAALGTASIMHAQHEKPDVWHQQDIATQLIKDGHALPEHSALIQTDGSAIETARQLAGTNEDITKLAGEIQAQAADEHGYLHDGTPVMVDTEYLDHAKADVTMEPQPSGQEYPTIVTHQP